MHISKVSKGHPILIYTGDENNNELEARYIDNANGNVFYIHNREICANTNSYIDKVVNVVIIIRDLVYKVECRVLGKGGKKHIYDTVLLEASGDLEQSSRRASVRFDIRTQTKVYEYDNDPALGFKGRFLCNCISSDISRDGIRIFANEWISADKGALFVLDFSVIPDSIFSFYSIPAKVVRSRRNVNIFTYPYDYGLKFALDDISDVKDKLFSDIFKLRLSKSASF